MVCFLLPYVGLTDADNHSAHLLVLEVLRWQRRNRVSNDGIDELLKLLRPFLADAVDNYPDSSQKAWRMYKEFIKMLNIHAVEKYVRKVVIVSPKVAMRRVARCAEPNARRTMAHSPHVPSRSLTSRKSSDCYSRGLTLCRS